MGCSGSLSIVSFQSRSNEANLVAKTSLDRTNHTSIQQRQIENGTQETVYTWNQENRLIGVQTPAGENISYEYDADGVRVSKTVNGVTTEYLVDKNRDYAQVLEERVNDVLAASYVYGLDLISQERGVDDSFYLVDGLGSTRGLTDVGGNVTDIYSYDAFGNLIGVTGGTDNDYLFAAEQFDEDLDQYYLRQRYYDTKIGRFARRDSWEGSINDPVSLHKYLYANGNPVNRIDPSGLATTVTGQEVHDRISALFVLQNPQLSPGEGRIASQNLQIKRLWQQIGINGTNIPYSVVSNSARGKKPDLVDFDRRNFYEIGTIKDRNKKLREIQTKYIEPMNNALKFLGRNSELWSGGTTFIAPPIMKVSTGATVLILPPFQGVISYQELFGDDKLFWFTIGSVITLEFARLIAQTSEASARATRTFGLA